LGLIPALLDTETLGAACTGVESITVIGVDKFRQEKRVMPPDGEKPSRPTIEKPLPLPGMGWSTFNFFVARHNEELFRCMAQAFEKSGLRDAGYTILRIDGGWWGNDGDRRWYYWTEEGKYAGGLPYKPGDPHVDPKNYPRGLKPLADHLHEHGLKLGFYLAPELSTGISANHPDNKDRKVPPPARGLELVDRHARWVADNGIDHLFYDGYDWNKEKGEEPYTRMFGALRQEARRVGRPIIFSINSGWKARPRAWADEWRTGSDINGEWRTILECLATVADPKPAGEGHWNNPDYLMVGFVSDEEAKSQMSLWCVAGAPLYLSHDHRVLNGWDRYVLLNTEAIAMDQDPAGTPGRRLRAEGTAQVWARTLADGSRAVVLLNTGDKPQTIRVQWPELGLPAGPAQVRDLWAHKNLGTHEKEYAAADLPPRGCAFLKVAAGDKPPAEPRRTWAPHPGKKPAFTPLPSKGWTFRTTMPRKDDPPANLFDGDPKTGWWSYAAAGHSVEIDFGKSLRFDRVVIDHRGTGPNPWPYKVYAPRSRFALEVSEDGKEFKKIAEDSFGPTYTIAAFSPVTARSLRIVLRELERTSAYDDTIWGAKDIFIFHTARMP
jgi:alpha-galactosidase